MNCGNAAREGALVRLGAPLSIGAYPFHTACRGRHALLHCFHRLRINGKHDVNSLFSVLNSQLLIERSLSRIRSASASLLIIGGVSRCPSLNSKVATLVSVPKPAPLSRSGNSLQAYRSSCGAACSRRYREGSASPSQSRTAAVPAFVLAERGEDIRIAGQLDIHLAVTLFELFIRSLRRTVITDGGSLDDKNPARVRGSSPSYISRAETISKSSDAVRRIERRRSGNKRCVRAAHGCGAAIAYPFCRWSGWTGTEPGPWPPLCRTGGDKNVPACQILLGQRLFNAPEQRGRVR